MYAMSGAVPAASAVVTLGRRSPVEVPPELAWTTMFGCVALKALASPFITVVVGGVCAVQNWRVTFPEELLPPEGLELEPEHAASATAKAAIPASTIRFILVSLFRQPGRRRSSLDGAGDRLDEPALPEKENEQHRHGGQGGGGRDGRPVGYVFTLERGEAHLHGERMTGRDRDQRPEQVVPRVDERDDAECGQGRLRERQHDLPEDLEAAAAVDTPRLLELSRERLEERVHEVDAERGGELRQDERPERVDEPDVMEDHESRDHRQLNRDEGRREHQDQHHRGPPELDARERVAGQAAQDQLGDDRGA